MRACRRTSSRSSAINPRRRPRTISPGSDDFESKAVDQIKAKGGTFKPFPADELKKWKAASPDFLDAWEKDTAAATKDAETPKKVAARWRQLLAEPQ